MNDSDLQLQDITLAEQMVDSFYNWEKRGRGWQVWDNPVELEPAFKPFYFHSPNGTYQVTDDTHKPSLFEKVSNRFKSTSQTEDSPYIEDSFDETPQEVTENIDLKDIVISLPANEKIDIDVAEQFLLNISYSSFPISFEVIGTTDSIQIQFTCHETYVPQLKQQLQAYFPNIVVNDEDHLLWDLYDQEKEIVIVDFALSQEFMRPLRTLRNLTTDPLIGIVAALENLNKDEMGIFQIIFQKTQNSWPESILRSVVGSDGRSFFMDAPEMVSMAKEKVKKPLFAVIIRVAAQSNKSYRAWEIVRLLGSGLSLVADPQSNELIPLNNDDYMEIDHIKDFLLRQTRRSGMLLNSEELVSLVHPPSASIRSQKLLRELKKSKTAPAIALNHQLVLGENLHQGERTKVTLSNEQRLRHMYVIGATGTGKTTLLLNLIVQDINNGVGVAVLDPHGDLIDNILGHIPDKRFEDVILLDPSDLEYPVGLNILSAHSDIEKTVLSSDLVDVFRRLSTSWGDQMTSVLGNALLAFLESDEGGTLVDLRRFLVEAEYRKSFLKTVKDPEIVYFWQKQFPMLKGNSLASILTRLDTFLRPKLIRNMVAQKYGINFQDILDNKRIFLVKLPQGLIGEENTYLLGSLIVSKLHQITMARQAKSLDKRDDFFLYLDEFQNFITPSMSSILSGARKYNLGLILAHQELRQLWNQDTEVANSAISNPYIRVCFRLGDFDSKKLEDGFSYFDAQDLQNIGIGEAICRIERNDFDFNMKTSMLPAIEPDAVKAKQEKIISLSRNKYGQSKEEIEAKLAQERQLITESPKPSSKKTEVPERKEQETVKIEESVEVERQVTKEPYVSTKKERPKIETPALLGKGGSQHKYLQNLIKRMAEEKGFRAVIEEQTPDGKGLVDVGLSSNKKRIACEISVTSKDEQELGNIEKCLKAGYDQVVLCSPEKRTLGKVKTLVLKKLKESEQKKILFFQPEELFFYLEKESATMAGKEKKVKGYNVKVNYQPVSEDEKKTKREALAKVILKGIRGQKGVK